ncbi:hypothetical protein OHA79_44735 (plasmid) [Streptomyces sp. NBC_00841]|uniref:hypothetical protein n=1 Tax=unclassified Streptomyces TaxID=2593676 RepID=UPI00225772B8|nr:MULTISPECIES: hypothetical protein [unclassified Streptomyces]MCX4538982.1 hypothetical protein [Streptomyces sp. NBC_01669]WSA04786.1 hypothetical protein OHA79_44735 [Streptomyces sp. NBC_00841]
MRRDRGLPVLREKDLVRARVDVGPLRQITVVLGRAGGGKWHVLSRAPGWRAHCRYAKHLTGSPHVLLDVLDQVCRHCAGALDVALGEEALWLAAAEVVTADARVRKLEEAGPGSRSWSGYAQVLWEAARHRDPRVRERLQTWSGDLVLGAAARQMMQAWAGVLQRSEEALAAWRAAAPGAHEATSVSAACNAVAADGQVHRQGLQLAAAVERSRWAQPFDAWATIRRAWSTARDQGGDAADARTAAMKALETTWGQARVRDVTALPEPAAVPSGRFTSPAQWADAEFQHLWRQYVSECCDKLEEALDASATGEDAGQQQLLLVTGWPLTRERDTELAYLAQYEQHGPVMPFGARRHRYGPEPEHAVVLSVPRFAAQHAAEHTRDDVGRIVPGPVLPQGAGPAEQDVLALQRGAYPYLATDTGQDGAGAQPTPLVTKARETRRSARRAVRAWAGEPDSIERYNALVVGQYSWVPDDSQGGTAAEEMASLPIHWLKDWTLCLDVECGSRPDTVLHRLYGTVTSFEPETGRLGFSPTGGHPAMSVPVHRIVALTGDEQRRRTGEAPAHEPYGDHEPGT